MIILSLFDISPAYKSDTMHLNMRNGKFFRLYFSNTRFTKAFITRENIFPKSAKVDAYVV